MCDKYIQKIIYKHITNLWLYSCGAQNRLSAWSAERFWPLRHPHLASSRTASASVTMQLTARDAAANHEVTYLISLWTRKKQTLKWVSAFLAPQTGLEPVTPRLTAACSTDWAIKAFKVFYHLSLPKVVLCRHRLIFPGRFQPSIVSTDELNYRVRNGNGWTLIAKNTDYLNF